MLTHDLGQSRLKGRDRTEGQLCGVVIPDSSVGRRKVWQGAVRTFAIRLGKRSRFRQLKHVRVAQIQDSDQDSMRMIKSVDHDLGSGWLIWLELL